MKKQPKPTKHSSVVFNQLCKLIPIGMFRKLATEYKVDKKSRTFSPWSHVVCLLYCQLTHCIGLNDLCDALRHHGAKLSAIREATAPSRNGLSHANKTRNADMMEALFWKMLNHLLSKLPGRTARQTRHHDKKKCELQLLPNDGQSAQGFGDCSHLCSNSDIPLPIC
ncbi:MAG: DUF4372 domain-containing protein [Puniceicoccaceae bacterium]|nr:MAG: DUF4372 domain-containing protein [Puniceicoccaceae bacterium]